MGQLTPDQLVALDNFRTEQGRSWKAELRLCWETGCYPNQHVAGYLQQLRNEFGPRWLIAYRVGDVRVGELVRLAIARINIARTWFVSGYTINVSGVVYRCGTKTQARAYARAHGITLLERED